MALPTTLTFEVQTGGVDTNSGAFNSQGASAGTDRTQSTTPWVNIDGATITSTVHTTTSIINIVGYTVSAADIRNTLRINSGTATAGLYEITAVDVPNNRWTLDRAAGTSTQTVIGKMGGCLLSPALASAAMNSNGGMCWIKSGTYTLSSASSNVAGGVISCSGSGAQRVSFLAYQTTRGDFAARAVFVPSINNVTAVTLGQFGYIRGVDANKNGFTGFTPFSGTASATFVDCIGRPTTGGVISAFGGGTYIRCQAFGGFIGFNSMTFGYYCIADGRTDALSTGYGGSGCNAYGCVAVGYTSGGFAGNGYNVWANCVAYNTTNAGTGFTAGTGSLQVNCVAYQSVTSVSARAFDGSRGSVWLNCYYGGTFTTINNNTNYLDQPATYGLPAITALSGDPFTNASTSDFSLNNTVGAGAVLRAAGYPSIIDWSANYATSVDVGAFQVPGSGGGASTVFILDDD